LPLRVVKCLVTIDFGRQDCPAPLPMNPNQG
jgi:hypothetical protein